MATARPAPPVPPPDAPGDLDKYARFIVKDVVTATTGEAAVCTVGTPGKTSYFRTHPDTSYYLHLHVLVYEGEGKRRTYLLDPALLGLPELEGLCKICRVVPYITHHGTIGIWLISIEYDDNPWIRSALNITEEAKAALGCRRGGHQAEPVSQAVPDPRVRRAELAGTAGQWLARPGVLGG